MTGQWTDALDLKVRLTVGAFVEDRRGFSWEDREDMEQEARLSCWRWIAANPDSTMGPGLCRILTVQECRDFERKTRQDRECLDTLPEWHDEGTDGEQEFTTALADILGKVVRDEREAAVAMLICYEELTVREAAAFLKVGRSTVQDIINRIRQRAEELGVLDGK